MFQKPVHILIVHQVPGSSFFYLTQNSFAETFPKTNQHHIIWPIIQYQYHDPVAAVLQVLIFSKLDYRIRDKAEFRM
jgi:hypothetical protein